MRYIIIFAFCLSLAVTGRVGAQTNAGATEASTSASTKEFMTSCTYGVLAGTLVGAATLAFEDRPGDKLQRVARGASIGLYLGIALGLYVLYGGGSDDEIEGQLPASGGMIIAPDMVSPTTAGIVWHHTF